MKRGGTKKRGKIKKGKGKVSDAENELANINQLLKARAQKNLEFYSDHKEKEIFRQAQLEKEKFGNTRPAELLKNRENNLLQQIRNNPEALKGDNLKKEMANLRRAKTNAIKANPLIEQGKSPKKPAKKRKSTKKKSTKKKTTRKKKKS